MIAAALVIVATVHPSVDLRAVADQLSAAARVAGCASPSVSMTQRRADGLVDVMVRCREAPVTAPPAPAKIQEGGF